jgi:hypothetical protein
MEYIWTRIPLFASNSNLEFTHAVALLHEIVEQSLLLTKQGQHKQAKTYFADQLSFQFPADAGNQTDIDYDTILDGPLANEFEYIFEKMVGVLREIRQEEVEYDYDFDKGDFIDRLEGIHASLDEISGLY